MKKQVKWLALWVILFVAQSVKSQTPTVSRVWYAQSPPTSQPNGWLKADVWADTILQKTYNLVNLKWVEVNRGLWKGQKGDKGDTGATGATGATGKDGVCPPCPQPVSSNIYVSPEQYGAVHANLTFQQANYNQAYVDSAYPNIGATVSDNIDWASWQMALKKVTTNGGILMCAGGDYYMGSDSLKVEKYAKNFAVQGSYATLYFTGKRGFYRPQPTNLTDANAMVELKFTIQNLSIYGVSSTIGIEIPCSYGAVYDGIFCYSLAENIHLRFALKTEVNNCFSTNCIKGWIADTLTCTGATGATTQSNHTIFNSCRYFGNGDVAFLIISSSGCIVQNSIIEGTLVRVGIEWNGNGSTVVKDGGVYNTHFECQQGATEAFVKARLREGIITLDKAFGQYPAILVDAGATVGYMTVHVSHVPAWVSKNGKFFNNAGASWILTYNDIFQTSNPTVDIPPIFNGITPALCGNVGCGSNRFFYTGIPR